MNTVVNFLMFFGALFAVIIALGQFFQKKRSAVNLLYGISFFGMGLWLFQISLYSSGILDGAGCVYYLVVWSTPVIFLVPPVMVVRYRWIISSALRFDRGLVPLFLPGLLSLLVLLAPAVHPGLGFSAAPYPGLPVTGEAFMSLSPYYKLLYIMVFLPNIYLVLFMSPILLKMSVIWKSGSYGRVPRVSRMGYVFALSIVLSNLLCIIGAVFSLALVRAAVLMANTATVFVYLVTQRHPDYMRLLKIETRKAGYERSRIKGLDIERIIERMEEIMRTEKAFADEELSLNDLARDLAISPHQLSQILNERLGKNFNTYVNEFRVEEARHLLVDEPERSVLSVGIAAGFNSNTTFCTVFAKLTGMSPGHYRRALLKKQS